MRAHLLQHRVVLLIGGIGLAVVLGYYLLLCPRPNCPHSSAMYGYKGGYLSVQLDSGELINTSNKTKLLYRTQIAHPDANASITLLIITGTELGKGSFIRVKPIPPPIHEPFWDYSSDYLQHWRYRVITQYGNPIIIELWGAPGTRNRLRVERIHYIYLDRQIEPDVPPGEPRPAAAR